MSGALISAFEKSSQEFKEAKQTKKEESRKMCAHSREYWEAWNKKVVKMTNSESELLSYAESKLDF